MTLTQEQQILLFQPQGSLDGQGGMALSEQIAETSPQPHQIWAIDLAEVDFMDSSGLVSLVKGLTLARENECRLVLCNVQHPVRLILELTQLDSVFEIFNTYEDVLSHVKDEKLALAL